MVIEIVNEREDELVRKFLPYFSRVQQHDFSYYSCESFDNPRLLLNLYKYEGFIFSIILSYISIHDVVRLDRFVRHDLL